MCRINVLDEVPDYKWKPGVWGAEMSRKIAELLFYKFDRLSQVLVLFLSVLLVSVVAVIDWATGLGVECYVFYFIPISMAAIRCRYEVAYLIAVLSAASWTVTDWLCGYHFKGLSYEVWNNFIRLMSFFAIAYIVTQIRTLLEDERQISKDLQVKLSEIKQLKELLPICAYCKKIRDDGGHWHQLEGYISEHVDTKFSHGACPECAAKVLKESGLGQ